jgi:hypothetical protein
MLKPGITLSYLASKTHRKTRTFKETLLTPPSIPPSATNRATKSCRKGMLSILTQKTIILGGLCP